MQQNSINNLSNGTCYFLSLDTMLEIDLLSEIPKLGDKEYSVTSGVEICKKNTDIEYSYKKSSSKPSITTMPITEVVYDDIVIPPTGDNETKIKCSSCNEIYSSNTLDEDVSAPDLDALTSDLVTIPVIYDEKCDYGNGCWRKADTTKAWYDYGNQRWANAIRVKGIGSYCLKAGNPCYDQIDKHNGSYYATAPANTPISFDDIYSFYVWIPRFDYKITGTYGVGGTQSSPGLIDIQFNSNLNATKTGDAKNTYYTHPAFTREVVHSKSTITNHKISGFWVEKFENNGIPYVRDEIYTALKNHSAPALFTYFLNNNMITNFEWAAIAYLSQSQYGIASGNNSSCNKKITSTYIYTSSSYIFEDGNGKGKSKTMSGLVKIDSSKCYTFDGKKISGLCSEKVNNQNTIYPIDILEPTNTTKQAAYCGSTTGTIYGVYDMVGGMSEYVFLAVKSPGSGVSIGPAYYYSNYAFKGAGTCYTLDIENTYGQNFNTQYLYTKHNSYDLDTTEEVSTYTTWNVTKTKLGDGFNETNGWFNNSFSLGCGYAGTSYTVNNGPSTITVSRGKNNIFDSYNSDGWNNLDSITRYTYSKIR